MLRPTLYAVLLPLTAALLPISLAAAAADRPTAATAVVFTSDRDGDSDLYYRSRNGVVVALTRNDASDFGAVYSPRRPAAGLRQRSRR